MFLNESSHAKKIKILHNNFVKGLNCQSQPSFLQIFIESFIHTLSHEKPDNHTF